MDTATPKTKERLQNALNLASSPNSSIQNYGWHAVIQSLSDLRGRNTKDIDPLKPKVESAAATAATEASLKALIQLYRLDNSLRSKALITLPQAGAIQYFAAALAEAGSSNAPKGITPNSHPIAPSGSPDRDLVNELLPLTSVPTPGLSQRIDVAMPAATNEKKLAYILLVSKPALRTALWAKGVENIQLMSNLLQVAHSPVTSPIDKILATNSLSASQTLLAEMSDDLAMNNLLSYVSINSITIKPQPTPDRKVVVQVSPGVMASVYHPYTGNAPGVDYGQTKWNGQADTTQLVPIDSVKGNIFFGQGQVQDSSWSVFQNSSYYLGGTFGVLQKAGLMDVGTDNVPANGFGVAYRIWRPVNDPNNGAVSHTDFNPAFTVTFGYKPSPECCFVALRWKGSFFANGLVYINCTSGSLYPGFTAYEDTSFWQVYCAMPNTPLEFSVNFDAEIIYQSTREGRLGYTYVNTIENYVELVEINQNNAALFNYVDLSIKEDPIVLNYPSLSSNGLLTYVATVEKAIADPNWPVAIDDDAATAAALALSKLNVLKHAAFMDLSATPGLDQETQQAPTKRRQQFLKAAFPLICYTTFNKYSESVGQQISLQSLPLLQLADLRQKITESLKDVAELSVSLGNQYLNTAANVLNHDPSPLDNLKQLTTALIGAQEELAELQEDLLTKKTFACTVLNLMQFDGIKTKNPNDSNLYLPMKSTPEILKFCQDQS